MDSLFWGRLLFLLCVVIVMLLIVYACSNA